MTVDELIVELQEWSREGHGDTEIVQFHPIRSPQVPIDGGMLYELHDGKVGLECDW